MRKQYHLKVSKNGFNAWDVNKLVEKSRNLPQILVNLENIKELDKNFWYQSSDDLPSVRSIADHSRLIYETDLKYPIILSHSGGVMDGMHRVAKAYLMGLKEIKAVQFSEEILPDYTDIDKNDLKYD